MMMALSSCAPAKSRQQAARRQQGSGGNLAKSAAAADLEGKAADVPGAAPGRDEAELVYPDKIQRVLSKALIPGDLARRVMAAAADGPRFILDLLACMEGDPYLRRLVDKAHALPEGYAPEDLVELAEGSAYRISRRGLMLRREAADALAKMAAASEADGAILVAASTYRSYEYQVEVYARTVASDGQEEADRVSARPGHSQHQTGLVVDFGPIDNGFAKTSGGRWMLDNAARFGWSLSFPDGYEALTGYVWESWHYRYVGQELAAFIDAYFDGIQQYALRFLHEWENAR
jgi:D-alanyl-D-alanine carboxypeptidase